MKFGKLLSLLAAVLFTGQIMAAVVQPEAATSVARNFMFERFATTGQAFSANDINMQLVSTRMSNGQPVYYIFDAEPGGWVIIAADDVFTPVIGYSVEGAFPKGQIDANFASFLSSYAEQIEFARQNNIAAEENAVQQWSIYTYGNNPRMTFDGSRDVEPLLDITWDQGSPYNAHCPADPAGPGGHVYAGCVATAMSQIINYWRYPLQGTGTHGYYSDYGYLFVDFGSSNYNYNEMNASIGGEYNYEMAEIQYHCGVAVDMGYSPTGSGAYSDDAAYALKNYFGYNNTLQLEYKDSYSNTEWANLLMENLDNGWPLYYHGFGTGGHAFNVDGYQGTDYFHFNWGWSGSYNGYFYLSSLNPGGNDFTIGQGAIVNFYPNTANYPYYCSGVDTLTRHNGTIEDGSGPVNNYTDNLQCGWLIAPTDSISGLTLYFDRFDLASGDILNLYDGSDNSAPLVGSYTLSGAPQSVTSNSGKFFIEFMTSGSLGKGWKVHYNSTIVNYCPGITEFSAPAGTFTDGSGNRDYHNSSICKYIIEPENAATITLSFSEFNTEAGSDKLRVYNLANQQLLGEYSGNDIPADITVPSGRAYVLFMTNSENTAPGWEISYSSTVTNVHDQDALQKNLQITCSPNPAEEWLRIEHRSKTTQNMELSLVSADGKIICVQKVITTPQKGDILMDVARYTPGLYILKYITDTDQGEIKVILK